MSKNRQESAMVHYKMAERLNPRSAKAFEGASTVYFLHDQNELSLQSAEQAIALTPNSSDAWCYKARAEFEIDENSPAVLESLEKARLLNPANGEVYAVLSEVYASRDNLPEALIAAQKHVDLHPNEEYAQEQKDALMEELSKKADAPTEALEPNSLPKPLMPSIQQ